MKFAMYNHRLVNASVAKSHLIYKCPFCGKRMVVHQSTRQRKAYFSHVLASRCYYNPGETSEHLMGKHQLARFFKTSNNSVIVEKYLSQINQWPDLMVNNMIIEFQCSPISIRKLSKRISGYNRLGLKSWWILGSPYQKRHLRSTYVARFLNYSTNLGFFLLFWKVKSNYLVIHYGFCEYCGRFSYQIRRIFTFTSLKLFIHRQQLNFRTVNAFSMKKAIISELKLTQHRLFHGDRLLMRLQQKISQCHNTLLGCPIVCHLPIFNLPIFNKRALLWRIVILSLIDDHSSIEDVYNQANEELGLPIIFCQINRYQFLYKMSFNKYLLWLVRFHYIEIDYDNKKITKLKEPRWFNSYYDKVLYLNYYY